ncbi:hypothetical protein VTN02DRAFT_3797 [Thermoascus thermophilus]
MLSSSQLKPAAPSASLLRYLRSQSDSLCFFTANPAPCAAAQRVPRAHPLRRSSNVAGRDPLPCQASAEASLFPIFNPFSGRPSSRPAASCQRSDAPPALSRSASTGRRPLLRRLLDLQRGKTDPPLNRSGGAPQVTTAVDDGAEGNIFNLGRTLTAKGPNELRLRCTEFDENGNVTLVNGEFKKSELIAKVGGPLPSLVMAETERYGQVWPSPP